VHPSYLSAKETGLLKSFMRIPAGTPPVFLAHAGTDPEASAEHSVGMYLGSKRACVPMELHVYAAGSYGFGVRQNGQSCCTWTDGCVAWLRNQGVLKQDHCSQQ
jgi:hypothetical protein